MRHLYALYAVITFSILFLCLFPLFILCSFLGKSGKLAIWYLLKGWGYIWLFLIGNSVQRIFIQKPQKEKNYIVIANHISYLDTAMIFRTLPFMVRPLAKKELVKIPLFGFLYKQMAVLVDRSNDSSKSKSIHLLQRTLKHDASIFIFPEGSFNETGQPLKHFYDGAFRIALQTKTTILPVIFPDTVHRFHYSSFWKWSPGKNRAVFLKEIPTDDYEIRDLAVLKKRVFDEMENTLVELRK